MPHNLQYVYYFLAQLHAVFMVCSFLTTTVDFKKIEIESNLEYFSIKKPTIKTKLNISIGKNGKTLLKMVKTSGW